MASSSKNLSEFDKSGLPDGSALHIGIVVAEWNAKITDKLFEGALSTLKSSGVKEENIYRVNVPGSFELPSGARIISSRHKLDAVICLGCVIQGETRHFEFICQAVAQGLTQLNMTTGLPHIFGVLTTENEAQALERAGGKHGNKGTEAAVTAVKMAALRNEKPGTSGIGFSK